MTSTPFEIADSVQLLTRTPALLDAWLRDLPESWLHADEGPDTFSPFEVVGHLISGERADWIERARHILDGREEPFTPFDRFSHREEFAGRPIRDLLDTFASLRARNLETLGGLGIDEAKLALPGLHPALGPVTLRQLLSTGVVHDLGHIAQISRAMASRYRERVGPWREYLPIVG